jgi:hypothetical protein
MRSQSNVKHLDRNLGFRIRNLWQKGQVGITVRLSYWFAVTTAVPSQRCLPIRNNEPSIEVYAPIPLLS